jgi:hypothetical protein
VEKADGHAVAMVLVTAVVLFGVGVCLWFAVARSMRTRAVREADAMSGWHDGLDALHRIDQRHHR